MFAFRPEVLAARRAPPLADALEWLPARARRWAWLVTIAFTVLAALLAQAPLRERARVGGQVVAVDGSTPVHSPLPGLVARLAVAEGQRVVAGERLFEIVRERSLASGVTDAGQLREHLQHRKRSLEAAHRDAAVLHERRLQGLAAQDRQLRAAERLVREEQTLAQEQLAGAARQYRARERLARAGVLPRLELERARQELGTERRQGLMLERELAATLARIAANEVDRAGLEAEWRAEQARYRLETSRLQSELTRVQADSRVVVTAPVAGRVSGLDARVGQRVDPGVALLTLEPAGGNHAVDLLLPSSAAGQARSGLAVRLHYSAYPQRRYGTVAGRIEYIADTPAGHGMHHESAPPLYRARVRVEDPRVASWSIRSGMTVEAELLLDARPLWRWVVDPARGWLGTAR